MSTVSGRYFFPQKHTELQFTQMDLKDIHICLLIHQMMPQTFLFPAVTNLVGMGVHLSSIVTINFLETTISNLELPFNLVDLFGLCIVHTHSAKIVTSSVISTAIMYTFQ